MDVREKIHTHASVITFFELFQIVQPYDVYNLSLLLLLEVNLCGDRHHMTDTDYLYLNLWEPPHCCISAL